MPCGLISSPCDGEYEGEGPYSAGELFSARIKGEAEAGAVPAGPGATATDAPGAAERRGQRGEVAVHAARQTIAPRLSLTRAGGAASPDTARGKDPGFFATAAFALE
jgi:hypothetical protein